MQGSEFLDKLEQINIDNLQQEKGVGKVLAQNLQDFLKSDRFEKLKVRFREIENKGKGININMVEYNEDGKTVCITGTFKESRDILIEKLIKSGFKNVSTVSKNTDFLLCGENAGSKLEKARKMGVKIINDINQILQ